jgi:hypothetical protein
MRTIYRLLSMIPTFGAAALVLHFFPLGGEFDANIVGWGWAVLVGAMIASVAAFSYLTGFAQGLFGISDTPHPVVRVVGKTVGYLVYAGIFLGLASLFPALITIVNPLGFLWFMAVLGAAFAIDDIVEARFFPKATETK